VQIVASVYIAAPAQSQKANVFQAYGGLNLHACEFCSRHAAVWNGDAPAWMCERCDDAWKSIQNTKPSDGSQPPATQARDELRRRRAATPYGDQADRGPTPQFAACFASYLTISRYGDIALRVTADSEANAATRVWRTEAVRVLVSFLITLIASTMLTLWFQSKGWIPQRLVGRRPVDAGGQNQ
jgi:ribosomal protein L37AE/L43A